MKYTKITLIGHCIYRHIIQLRHFLRLVFAHFVMWVFFFVRRFFFIPLFVSISPSHSRSFACTVSKSILILMRIQILLLSCYIDLCVTVCTTESIHILIVWSGHLLSRSVVSASHSCPLYTLSCVCVFCILVALMMLHTIANNVYIGCSMISIRYIKSHHALSAGVHTNSSTKSNSMETNRNKWLSLSWRKSERACKTWWFFTHQWCAIWLFVILNSLC